MATIHIDLQDGFADDNVVIRLDGQEVYRGERLTTKMLYGLTDSTEAEVEAGTVELEISLEGRDLSYTLLLEVEEDVWVGFSVEGGELRPIVSEEPFGYG